MKLHPAPTSRRGWLKAADNADLSTFLFGELSADGEGRLNSAFVTIGPKFYVRRLAERFGRTHGFVVGRIRRHGRGPNALTGEIAAIWLIEFRRVQ